MGPGSDGGIDESLSKWQCHQLTVSKSDPWNGVEKQVPQRKQFTEVDMM